MSWTSYVCTSHRCSENSVFSWNFYLDTRVFSFWVFHTSPGHVLHFYLCVAYLFMAFTHQIICVHPTDAAKNPHFFWDIYPDTRVVFFSDFLQIPRTCTTFLHVCDIFIQDIYPPKLFLYIPQMLQKFYILPGHLPEHHESFSSYSASSGSSKWCSGEFGFFSSHLYGIQYDIVGVEYCTQPYF